MKAQEEGEKAVWTDGDIGAEGERSREVRRNRAMNGVGNRQETFGAGVEAAKRTEP